MPSTRSTPSKLGGPSERRRREDSGKTFDVLIEINIGGEEAKSGIAPDSPELEQILAGRAALAASAHPRD